MPLMKLSTMRWAAIAFGAFAFGGAPSAMAAPSPAEAGLRLIGDIAAAGVANSFGSLSALAVDDERGRRSHGDRDRRGDRRDGRRDDRGDRRRDRSDDRGDRRRDRYADRNDRRNDRYDDRRDRRDDRYDGRRDRRNDRYDSRRDHRYARRDDHRDRRHYSGRRHDYGYSHGHGPRRGHGYYCNDHYVFHYYSGYDPYGWRRAYYSGYYPPRGCYLVERVEYRRGRRVLVGGYSCVDPYGYAYIDIGSQFVLRYY